jgi:hypothetical protein
MNSCSFCQDINAPLGFITLYEGNGGTQNVVCNLSWEDSDKFWNFQDYTGCANDETRYFSSGLPDGYIFIRL